MKLEQLQEYADAIETVNHHQKLIPMRIVFIVCTVIGHVFTGFLIMAGITLFNWMFP